ncbi:MAG: hypothetical protein IJP16_05000 [Clostridia bacterium]|nr:hypothetical protein [Clostridia bacterium]MBQ9975849.1 hypothetical protein [Clostridia bacterium]
MTERKFTDEEIIEFLRKQNWISGVFPKEDEYFRITNNDIADLISRQKAEIESLKKTLHELKMEAEMVYKQRDVLKKQVDTQKAEIERLEEENRRMKKYYFTHDYHECHNEAIKEFAERLKERTYPFPCAIGVENAVTIRAINDLVKELTEENKGQAVSV